ncbi:hypothetical protein CMI47_04775 [Candidatus Pacearchaeota archaeon]|nr:hypothetical protein [Candidatus Pacearchaeota archaeon]|tara:strand:- start:1395 stop:2006 length:612 start_codon:yes stop_codon:yes gene_type:complete
MTSQNKWIDITHITNGDIPIWPGSEAFKIETKTDNETKITESYFFTNAHHGTHIDAPLHHIFGGERIDTIDVNRLCGTCEVIHIESNSISKKDINNITEDIVLFKTREDLGDKFNKNYTYLEPSAAQLLVEKHVKMIGIDYLSVENFESNAFLSHKILLTNSILIIESLNLKNVKQGKYQIMALPIRIQAEAAPCRVVIYPLT